MKILILTYGTRGDVQPFIALSKALQEDGHSVTLATASRFAPLVATHDVNFAPLGDGLLSIIDTQQGRQAMEGANGFLGMIKTNLKLMKRVKPLQAELVQDCWDVAEKVRPDLIVFHPKAFAAYAISERMKVPLVMALLIPMLVPTNTTAHLGFPKLKLGRLYNRLTHQAVQLLMRMPARKTLNHWRTSHGFGKQPLELFKDGTGAQIPIVAGFSEAVIDRPADWPPNLFMGGFWFLQSNVTDALSEEVETFLNEGDPPICFGFGSMVGSDPMRLRKTILGALEETGQRGLILSGWGGVPKGQTHDLVLEVNSAPHDLLLPRVLAMVHHGGAGTTAAALRAGVSQIIIPFMGDQPFWGQRMKELGVAPDPIRQKDLTITNLKGALDRIVNEPSFYVSALKLSKTIKSENGGQDAASFIKRVWAERSSRSA
ncbi:glycosyltransferase [Parasphingorhabdus litoris]|uniref:Glycosyltransferase n=1 Tax=Parasphingorhabdus litoris TaxID=394733 RepID=A0ABP3JV60_9SPHN|nr:glycosyltransferase [Parasphingorhabdus litoris]